MGQYAQWGPQGVTLIDSATVDPRAVAEVKETTTQHGGSQGIKLHDKVSTLKLLGQHIGMFTDKVEHSGKIEHGVTVADIRKAIGLDDGDDTV